jgi:hypothetical protein
MFSINYWQELKRFINHRQIGEIITRQQLMNLFRNYLPYKSPTTSGYTFDKYRRYLTVIKILDHVGRGRYRINEHIPPWMTSKYAQYQAMRTSLRNEIRGF